MVGDLVEQAGEVLEIEALGPVGVGIQIIAVYWETVHTFIEAEEQRNEGGEVRGSNGHYWRSSTYINKENWIRLMRTK